jgi:AraC-like DNA-binding protein
MSEINMGLREIHMMSREINNIGRATREWIITEQRCPLRAHGFGLAGWSRARDGFFFVRPSPHYSQILACVSGHGEVLVNGTWEVCGPGSAYLTPIGARNAYRAIPGETWRVSWVHQDANFATTPEPALVTVTGAVEMFDAILHGLYAEVNGMQEPDVLEDWLRLLQTQVRRISRPAASPSRLQPLWNAVAADPSHAWSIAELAERAGMSIEHLRRLALSETGRSPMKQVTHLRMRHAEALLGSRRYPIAEVAERVGYENAFAFSTAFKRETGRPPSEARG